MPLTTPVAFMIFNRPDLTQRVFEVIARVKPKQLFVVADGPRFPEETEKCEQARAVVDRVNWECDTFTNFSEENLGCGRRISSGIDWVFSKVEEAIFIEDDCLPNLSFFPYCQELLKYYRRDQRVMTINGNNFQSGRTRTEYSYHFSKYPSFWGWATWRRAWNHYDFDMKFWPEFKQAGMLKMVCDDHYEQRFWTNIFDSLYEDPGIIDTWDHQWNFACWSQNGLAIEPGVNLVSNLGFGRPDASHTAGDTSLPAELFKTEELGEIRHPPFVIRNSGADAYIFDHVIGGQRMKKEDTLIGRMLRGFSSINKKAKVTAGYD